MLPANMRGVQYSRNSRARQTFSSPIRNNGCASRHCDSPAFRYWTAIVALRLLSPLIFHSNARLLSVEGSTLHSPRIIALLFCPSGAVPGQSIQMIVRTATILVIWRSACAHEIQYRARKQAADSARARLLTRAVLYRSCLV